MAISKETEDKIARFEAIKALLTEDEIKALMDLGEFLNTRFSINVPEVGLSVVVNMFDPHGIAEEDPGFTEGPVDLPED